MADRWCWSMLWLILPRKLCHFRKSRSTLLIISVLCLCFLLVLYEKGHHSIQRTSEENVSLIKKLMDHNVASKQVGLVQDTTVKTIPTPIHLVNGRAPKQVEEVMQTKHETEERDAAAALVAGSHPSNTTRVEAGRKYVNIDALPSLPGVDSLGLLQKIILKHNRAPPIYNEDRFPPLGEEGVVLIVQVHKREKYLKLLLESLKAARGIENMLLVISHDYYYDDMNKIIKSIDFCRVIQIFYPLSLQVIPTSFPGASKEDCPRDVSKQNALKMNCANAQHPDAYGHYREAIVTAIKHHWWWKINTVFDQLLATKDYNGYVFFLEEDHYVSPDFLEVAKQLIQLKQEKCHECDFINLGMYTAQRSFSNKVSQGIWNAGKNNMGFGMNRTTWNRIRNCSKYFCTYDDYNWDWSLNQLGKACPLLDRDIKVLVIKTPRIFHIGTCGTHHHKSCNELKDANLVRSKINRLSSDLFPSKLILDHGLYPTAGRRKLKAYGGWGDIRDHELCMRMAEGKALI